MACCCIAEICIVAFSIFLIILIRLFSKNPPPIFNVYQRANGFYCLKVGLMYTIFIIRKLLKGGNQANLDEYEKPQKLSNHPKAVDAVYFNAANKSGDHFVIGTSRRKDKLLDGFMYLLIQESNLGLLESPRLPSTSLYQTEEVEEYSAEGIKVSPMTPFKTWKITYEGKMKRSVNRDEEIQVKIDLTFESCLPIFNFDTDMHPLALAKAMAFETFSREYFKNLQKNHQTHYEQFGNLSGCVSVAGRSFQLDLDSARDHTFGAYRDWRILHRYGVHVFTAENGDHFNVSVLSVPISFSRLVVGYVYSAKDKKIHPVESCDLELYQHGENGQVPVDYAFSFKAGGKEYTVEVFVKNTPHFYISKEWESKIVEGLSSFCVNGMCGWGAVEWLYRNANGKNVEAPLQSA